MNDLGGTPLHWAAHSGNTEAMLALKEGGAALAVKNNRGNTPFQVATNNGESDAAELLESWGA